MSNLENHPLLDSEEPDIYNKPQLEPCFYNEKFYPVHILKELTPNQLKNDIHNCFACDHKRYQKSLELSNFTAPVMVIGETPSDVMFNTVEGKLLADTLTWAQYNLNDIYFTSLVKCEESNTPERCQHFLIAEILCVQPQVIIGLGYDVGKYFDAAIDKAGYWSQLLQKYPFLITYRTKYAMADQTYFQDFCNHLLQARQYYTIT